MLKKVVVIVLLMSGLLFLVTNVGAFIKDAPPPQPGFTHSPLFQDDSPDGHGIVLSGGDVFRSSPVIADIDGNASNGQEVAVGGGDGMLYVYGSNGQLLWSKTVVSGCAYNPEDAATYSINSAPAVGRIYGENDVPYVVIGYGTFNNIGCDGGVAVFRGPDGAEVWRYSLRTVSPNENLHGVVSSPALADTDGDGQMEIGFGGLDRYFHLLNADGTVRWRYEAADTMWSSPVFVNVDDDAPLEVIFGADISANPNLDPPTNDGGYLYAFDTQPRTPSLINFREGALWRTDFDQAIYSSPAIGDVLPENEGDEIIIGNSCHWPAGNSDKRGKWIKILRLSNGQELKTLNVGSGATCVQSSPSLGDIDDDGALEIVVTAGSAEDTGGDGLSRVIAWDPNNTNPKWTTIPRDPNTGSNDSYGGDLQSPVIADLDGNGSLEVVVANFWSVHVLNGQNGQPLTCQGPSCGDQLSLFAWDTLKSTPAIGDLDGDGDLEVVIGGGHVKGPNVGLLYAWTDFAGLLNSPAGSQDAYSMPWPMFRRTPEHQAIFTVPPTPELSLSLTSLSMLAEEAMTSSGGSFKIEDNGTGGTLQWRVTTPDGVTATPDSGTGPATVNVTVDIAERLADTYDLGAIQVDAGEAGTASVSLRLVVVEELERAYLPLMVK